MPHHEFSSNFGVNFFFPSFLLLIKNVNKTSKKLKICQKFKINFFKQQILFKNLLISTI